MLDVSQIDLLLGIGLVVAVIAIGGGVRGVYSVSALSRQDRTNQATTTLPVRPGSGKRDQSNDPSKKRRRAA